VDNFGVSGTRACADPFGCFDNHDFASRLGKGACNCESYNASTNNDAINIRTHIV
jgi:hypothetical protein